MAELTVFFCEQSSGFAADVAMDDESSLGALVRMFEQALRAVAAVPESQGREFLAREAYTVDLNNFFPGLAALQMGRILQSLARSPSFQNLFEDEQERDRYLQDRSSELTALEHVVRAAIKARDRHGEGRRTDLGHPAAREIDPAD